jgi:hypothetical protein
MAGQQGGKNTYHDNISTTLLRWPQWTALGEPVTLGILGDPVNDSSLLLRRDALIRVADTLQDIVGILGDAEHTRTWLRYCSKSSAHEKDITGTSKRRTYRTKSDQHQPAGRSEQGRGA